MTINAEILDVLFRKISPSKVFDLLKDALKTGGMNQELNLFQRYAVPELSGYSKDEIALLSRYIWEQAEMFKNTAHYMKGRPLTQAALALNCVLIFAKQLLCLDRNKPVCSIESVSEWRKAYLYLGQDLFVCAFLAEHDIEYHYQRLDFTWPAVLNTNHRGLNDLISKGIAENHNHLWGSSRIFPLSWASLMNYPETHQKVDRSFQEQLQPHVVYGQEQRFGTASEQIRYACYLRMFLFEWLNEQKKRCQNEEICSQRPYKRDCEGAADQFCSQKRKENGCGGPCEEENRWDWVNDIYLKFYKLLGLRQIYGAKVPQPNGKKACLDYAFTEQLYKKTPDACYRLLAGERYFIYVYFRAFLMGKTDSRYDLAFYLYIVLKLRFRSELIQVNKVVGFRNFSDYQDRKTELCGQPFYQAELIRMAINAPLSEENVWSLETRFGPQKTPMAYYRLIKNIKQLKDYADKGNAPTDFFDKKRRIGMELIHGSQEEGLEDSKNDDESYGRIKPEWLSFPDGSTSIEKPYFYLIHFIKRPDVLFSKYYEKSEKSPSDLLKPYSLCRNQNVRDKVHKQALALFYFLHRSRDRNIRDKVRGIDCASHEIGCPPEVFATAYRFLRGYLDSDASEHPFLCNEPHYLSATYHAGEDFLDILSALRTIDEAVNFLDLRRGDRIGHALGLGVNPNKHYETKGYRVFLHKQDRLDDLVWLLNRCRNLGLRIDPHIYGKLKQEAELLFHDIYGLMLEELEPDWNISLTEYYCSMALRADDPILYKGWHEKRSEGSIIERDENGERQYIDEHPILLSPYDRFLLSKHEPALDRYRKSKYLTGLCHYYHYSMKARREGYKTWPVEIDKDYIRLMLDAQDILQKDLANKGIAIECNPSSNVLIGTFREYKYHPIFRFNHVSLQHHEHTDHETQPLQVCINTDDLGIFDTSLAFEYSLLFDALNNIYNDQGKKEYSEDEILTYLKSIRKMGNLAVFPYKN